MNAVMRNLPLAVMFGLMIVGVVRDDIRWSVAGIVYATGVLTGMAVTTYFQGRGR